MSSGAGRQSKPLQMTIKAPGSDLPEASCVQTSLRDGNHFMFISKFGGDMGSKLADARVILA